MSKTSAAYLELTEALAEGGCPICGVGKRVSQRFLDGMLFDSVNDREIRAELARAFGLCPRHNHLLTTIRGERLGIAILERAFLQEARRRLQAGQGLRTRSRLDAIRQRMSGRPATQGSHRGPPLLAPRGDCMACARQQEAEERVAAELAMHLADDLGPSLAAVGGLCWDHLDLTLRLCADDTSYKALVEIQTAAWDKLIGHLDEFIRKRDYRFRHEPLTTEEGLAPDRGAAALSGEPW